MSVSDSIEFMYSVLPKLHKTHRQQKMQELEKINVRQQVGSGIWHERILKIVKVY